MTDLRDLDLDVDAARMVDEMERDARDWAAEHRRREGLGRLIHAGALPLVALLAWVLTAIARKASR